MRNLLIIFTLLLLSGCSSDDDPVIDPFADVIADPDFMFNTTISVSITLQSRLMDVPVPDAYLEIFDALPADNGKLLLQAYTDSEADFTYNITIVNSF